MFAVMNIKFSRRFMLLPPIILIYTNIIAGCNTPTPTSTSTPTSILIKATPTPTPTPTPTITKQEKKVTVFISVGGEGVGSGVIIGQNGEKVYILTARHVIDRKPGLVSTPNGKEPEDPYKITINDGEEFLVGYDNYDQIVNKIKNIDFAILEFSTKINYKDQVAQLTNSFSINQPISIFGYIPCSPKNKDNKKQEQLSHGNIAQNMTPPDPRDSEELEGYDIAYNNNTVPGMSGSPIFDNSGHLIAIHALGGEEKYNQDCESLPSEPRPEFGKNWGISMKKFLEYKSYFPDGLKSKLQVPNYIQPLQPNTVNPVPSPTPTPTKCPVFIGINDNCKNMDSP
jgi:Trypsin-like peptidase domain